MRYLLGALLLTSCLGQYGSEGDRCYPNRTCDAGLMCILGDDGMGPICIKPQSLKIFVDGREVHIDLK